jgi:hypothetical protein
MTILTRTFIALALAGVLSACSSRVDLDKVPIGTTVEVTRQDGGVVRGTLSARDDQNLHVSVGRAVRSIPRDQIASLERADTAESPRLPSVAKFREYTLPAGTRLSARLETSLGSDSSRINDPVQAVLLNAVVIDGVEVVPADSTINGVVTTAEKSGNVRGRASLAMQFNSITLAGGGDTYALSSSVQHTAAATKGDDAKKIGIPAVGGAILGAILGGKKGALIGTAVGGGAGAVVVLTTSGPEVRYTRGTTLALSLDQAIDVRVPIRK